MQAESDIQAMNSHSTSRDSDNSKVNPIYVEAVNDKWHLQEAAHRQEENRYWRWSLALSGGAAFAAAIGAILAYAAFTEARRQADAAAEANRPWLQVDSVSMSNIRRDDDTVEADFSVFLRNYGHSPALQVSANSNLRLFGEFDTTKSNIARIICEASNAANNDGVIAFPSTSRTYVHAHSKTAISAMRERYALMDASSKEPLAFNDFIKSVHLEVIGCVGYADSSGKSHVTSFDFIFAKTSDLSKVGLSKDRLDGDEYLTAVGYAK